MFGVRTIAMTLVAAFVAPTITHADPLPTYGAGVQYSNAYVVLEVNGAPVLTFGEDGEDVGYTGGGGGPISNWLMPGKNEIALIIEKRGDSGEPAVSLEISDPSTGETAVSEQFTKAGRHVVRLDDVKLPPWSFMAGETWAGDEKGLTEAVHALYSAATKRDVEALMTMHGPFIEDTAKLWSLDPAEMREELADAFGRSLSIDPLPKLTLRPYLDGKVVRVTGPKDEAPIEADGADDMHLEMGEWWSKLEGEWKVVR